jgi:2-succinyl-6-hydroxy-2,4-cyclohexadiene-1-carboxylate synthase
MLRSGHARGSPTMIVLLHGFTGDASSWDRVVAHWQLHQPALSELVRAVELPGHGAGPEVAATWDDNVAAVGERLGAAPDDITAVGYSLGARVALGLLAARRVRRAVLVSVNPGIDDRERAARRAADARWTQLLRERGIAAFADAWQAQPLFATQSSVSPAYLAQRLAVRRAQSPESLARSLETMGLAEMPDYRPALAALAPRLELVVGALDDKFCALAASAAAAAPALRRHVVAGCGHDVPLEQPEALAALLLPLLRSAR